MMENTIERHFVPSGGLDAGTLALLKDNNQPNIAEIMAMANGGGGMGGGNNGMLWIFMILLFGMNGQGGLFGKNGQPGALVNEDHNTDLLMQAINGNKSAVDSLATNLNCSVGRIETAICSLSGSIDKVAGEVRYSSAQVINAVQAGNCDITSKLQECCCATQRSIDAVNLNITKMGYEDQLAVQQQTNQLTSMFSVGLNNVGQKIDNQTIVMQAGFQGVKDLFCQQKIDALQATNAAYSNQLSQMAQTAAIRDLIDPLKHELSEIQCKLPKMPVPAIPVSCAYPYTPYNPISGNGNCQ